MVSVFWFFFNSFFFFFLRVVDYYDTCNTSNTIDFWSINVGMYVDTFS